MSLGYRHGILNRHRPAQTAIFGLGLISDGKSNIQIKSASSASYFFIASTTSAANSVRLIHRGGTGYSLGTGGTLSVSIQADNGSGLPSGTNLSGTTTYAPGNPGGDWEIYTDVIFGTKPTLAAGTKYHLVFTNANASNYYSLNTLYRDGGATPNQPRWADADFGVLENNVRSTSETPVFDLTYANGTHDGQSVYEAGGNFSGAISGNSMVREYFGGPIGSSFTTNTLHLRLQRTSGTSPLTATVETFVATGIGTAMASGTVAAAGIPVILPPYNPAGGPDVTIALSSSVTFVPGTKYSLRLSCPSGTTYTVFPLRTGDDLWSGNDNGFRSWSFKTSLSGGAGDAPGSWSQKTTNASTWVPLYDYGQEDLQFYFA